MGGLTPPWDTPSSLQLAWRSPQSPCIARMPEAAPQQAALVACPAQGLCCILPWVEARREAGLDGWA